jgi:hypothetical protein
METKTSDVGLAAYLYLRYRLLRLDTLPDSRREFIFEPVPPDVIRNYYEDSAQVNARSYQKTLRIVRGMLRPPR